MERAWPYKQFDFWLWASRTVREPSLFFYCLKPSTLWDIVTVTLENYRVGQKVPSDFLNKIKDFFIFTKNFIEQHIHHFVPLPSAIFQATS